MGIGLDRFITDFALLKLTEKNNSLRIFVCLCV